MSTQAEAAAQLNKANESLTKIGTETTALLEKVKALEEVAGDSDNDVSTDLQDAINAVVAQAKAVDDLVPDAPTP